MMDKIKAAAIVILGLGDKYASDILRNLDAKEVEAIVEAINNLGDVTEVEMIEALNLFMKDSVGSNGIDAVSKENLKNSLTTMIESRKIESKSDDIQINRNKWFDIFRLQSTERILAVIQEEHPQVITVVVAFILTGEKASQIVKLLPKEVQAQVVKRIANIGPVSAAGMDYLARYFETELHAKEKHSEISVDGVEAVANIISYLDTETERSIISEISSQNKDLSERIQEKVLPFERLAKLDRKSLQTLLAEVSNDDLVLALKGVDGYIKDVFMSNMSSKSADILRDEMDSKGPVKLIHVVEAQKRIIALAKQMASEERIMLSLKVDSDVVY